MSRAFLDTNVLVYVFSDDPRQDRARSLLRQGGVISVQSLNEFANVARRKLRMDWSELRESLAVVRGRCSPVLPVTDDLHRDGLRLAERYGFSIYDGTIVAAALSAGCELLYSEDMHAGLVIDGTLTVVNPFA